MRILALSGSSSSTSINQRLLATASDHLPEGVEVQSLSVRDLDAPLFSVDLEAAEGIPASIVSLRQAILEADAVILASPEHNGSMPAMLKNALDWLSRVEPGQPWFPRPLAILSTSPGARGGATNARHMAELAPFWGAEVVGTFSLGSYFDAYDDEAGELRNADRRAELEALLGRLLATARGETRSDAA